MTFIELLIIFSAIAYNIGKHEDAFKAWLNTELPVLLRQTLDVLQATITFLQVNVPRLIASTRRLQGAPTPVVQARDAKGRFVSAKRTVRRHGRVVGFA